MIRPVGHDPILGQPILQGAAGLILGDVVTFAKGVGCELAADGREPLLVPPRQAEGEFSGRLGQPIAVTGGQAGILFSQADTAFEFRLGQFLA